MKNRPELDPPLRWWLEAFFDLSRGRQITMGGAGPISLSEMLAFMQIFEIASLDDRAYFVRLMGALDGAYLEHASKRQSAAS